MHGGIRAARFCPYDVFGDADMMESKVLMTGVLIALGTMSGCYEESAPEEVVLQSINCEDRQFDWLKEYIPVESTDIKARRKQGDFLCGALIRIRCHVEPDAMRRFIEKGTFRYRFDSTLTNANPRYQQAVWEIPNCPHPMDIDFDNPPFKVLKVDVATMS